MSDASQKGIENEKLSTALNEIFSNPQMLSAISSMAKNLKDGDHSSVTTEKKEEAKEEIKEETPTDGASAASVTDKLPQLLNMLSSSTSNIKQSRRSELLCALKPYLSQNRSDAIDKIIRFSELSSVFKNLS